MFSPLFIIILLLILYLIYKRKFLLFSSLFLLFIFSNPIFANFLSSHIEKPYNKPLQISSIIDSDYIVVLSGNTQRFLIGMDLDPYALKYTEKRLSRLQKSYSLHNRNYREYPLLLQSLDVEKLTGIIFDLGSSSSQIDSKHRGFSFKSNAPLDMRFDLKYKKTAYDILNTYGEKEIAFIINSYGEERNYKNIAKSIVKYSKKNKMITPYDLKKSIENY